jgi:hypothetical protein
MRTVSSPVERPPLGQFAELVSLEDELFGPVIAHCSLGAGARWEGMEVDHAGGKGTL